MIHRFSIRATIVSTVLLLSLSAQAIPTSEIIFDQSSHCGTYKGDLTEGMFFTLSLGPEQKLTVNTDGHVQSVEDSEGEVLADQGGHKYRYFSKNPGTHKIKMVGRSSSEVEFCVSEL